jgi:predicted RNase H-like nuclease
LGFSLATKITQAGTRGQLLEVYPHPALLALLAADYRIPCKVSKSLKYWPGTDRQTRIANLLEQFSRIHEALARKIHDIPPIVPDASAVATLTSLKRFEDALDALVCAWVGMRYLGGKAVAYGNDTAAIWVPGPTQAGSALYGPDPL